MQKWMISDSSKKTKTQNCVLKSLIFILPRKRQGTDQRVNIQQITHITIISS